MQVNSRWCTVYESCLLQPGMTHVAGTKAEAASTGGAAALRNNTTCFCTVSGAVYLDNCTGTDIPKQATIGNLICFASSNTSSFIHHVCIVETQPSSACKV